MANLNKGNSGGKRKPKALPRHGKAKISNNKIDGYILSSDNKNGKAGFFKDILGYNDKKTFRADVKKGLKENKATFIKTTIDGQKVYNVIMKLGVNVKREVVTVWKQATTKSNPEFITAYPQRKKEKR